MRSIYDELVARGGLDVPHALAMLKAHAEGIPCALTARDARAVLHELDRLRALVSISEVAS